MCTDPRSHCARKEDASAGPRQQTVGAPIENCSAPRAAKHGAAAPRASFAAWVAKRPRGPARTHLRPGPVCDSADRGRPPVGLGLPAPPRALALRRVPAVRPGRPARSRTRPSAAASRCGGRRRRPTARRARTTRGRRRCGGAARPENPWGVAPEPGCVPVAAQTPAPTPTLILGRAGPAAATFRSGTRRGPFPRCGPRAARGARAGAPAPQADPAPPGRGIRARAITGAAPFRSGTLHTPPFSDRGHQARPSTAPALVDAVGRGGRAGAGAAPRRPTRRVGATAARGPDAAARPRAHPETRSRLAAVDAAARAAFVRRQRGAE